MQSNIQQALPRVLIHRTYVVKKKWKLRVTLQPDEGEPSVSNDDFDED